MSPSGCAVLHPVCLRMCMHWDMTPIHWAGGHVDWVKCHIPLLRRNPCTESKTQVKSNDNPQRSVSYSLKKVYADSQPSDFVRSAPSCAQPCENMPVCCMTPRIVGVSKPPSLLALIISDYVDSIPSQNTHTDLVYEIIWLWRAGTYHWFDNDSASLHRSRACWQHAVCSWCTTRYFSIACITNS